MISFDYITLKAFCAENKDFFSNARLQKIQQPSRRDIIMSFRGKCGSRKLYINIDPQIYHLCFADENTIKKRHIIIPQKPPMFCMLLRKHLEGAKVTGINVPPYERIFEIFFESYNELNEKSTLCLCIELMGKYSNIILYDYSTKIITGCAHNVGSEKSRNRELSGTLSYIYPSKQNKSDILHYFGEVHYGCLNDDFWGISKSFQDLAAKKQVPLEKIKDYLELNSPVSPAIDDGIYSVYSELLDNPTGQSSVNSMIDNYYSKLQANIIKNNLKRKLENIIKPKYQKTKNSLNKIYSQIKKNDNAVKYKNYADLIISNLYNFDDYRADITVFDLLSETEITIMLDKTKTLKENAANYYKLYSHSKKSKEKLLSQVKELNKNCEYLEQILYTTLHADTIETLTEILLECESAGLSREKERNITHNNVSNIKKLQINGFSVYIGQNNRQNDFIVSKIAAPEDYWFHSKNCPGSHILLKITDDRKPDKETLYECAKLAKKYSAASDDTKSGVIYTKRKYIKKPPKSNLGFVTYKNEKEIIVNSI